VKVLDPSKFQFAKKEIEFAGFKITSNDVKPLPKYLHSIRTFPRPKNIADIHVWFGLVNQVSHYSKLSDIMEPFKALLSPKSEFLWTEELELSFQTTKRRACQSNKRGSPNFRPKTANMPQP